MWQFREVISQLIQNGLVFSQLERPLGAQGKMVHSLPSPKHRWRKPTRKRLHTRNHKTVHQVPIRKMHAVPSFLWERAKRANEGPPHRPIPLVKPAFVPQVSQLGTWGRPVDKSRKKPKTRNHSDKFREKALLTLAANSGNLNETARQLKKVSVATLRRWRDEIQKTFEGPAATAIGKSRIPAGPVGGYRLETRQSVSTGKSPYSPQNQVT